MHSAVLQLVPLTSLLVPALAVQITGHQPLTSLPPNNNNNPSAKTIVSAKCYCKLALVLALYCGRAAKMVAPWLA
jgi:hypothetical protein